MLRIGSSDSIINSLRSRTGSSVDNSLLNQRGSGVGNSDLLKWDNAVMDNGSNVKMNYAFVRLQAIAAIAIADDCPYSIFRLFVSLNTSHDATSASLTPDFKRSVLTN